VGCPAQSPTIAHASRHSIPGIHTGTGTSVPVHRSQLDATSQEDIRSRYAELNLDTARMLTALQNLAMPQGAAYSLEDWNATKYILALELQAVEQVQTLYRQTEDLLNAMQLEQTEDLNAVMSNLQAVAPAAPATSWSDIVLTIMSDALGVLSVVPDAKVGQMALLVGQT
jgi:hypothetical protein